MCPFQPWHPAQRVITLSGLRNGVPEIVQRLACAGVTILQHAVSQHRSIRSIRSLPKRLRLLGAEQFDTVAVPGSRPGFALVYLGDVDDLPGLGRRQCAFWCVWRKYRTRAAHPVGPDVLHPVLIQEIAAMLKCFASLKNNLRDRASIHHR